MSADATAPDTIVLIHGFWVTPRSWEHCVARYESRGYRVLAPAYPGFEVEVESLNADPSPIDGVTVPAIIEHLEVVISELDSPPILIGHSAGGVFTQILLDHGIGAAGVALNSAPTEGVKVVPLSQIRATFPILKDPANRHKAVGLTLEQWRYAFTRIRSARTNHGACTSATTSRPRARSSGQRACEHPSGPRRQLRQLLKRRPRAVVVHLRQRGPPDAAVGATLKCRALQVQDDHPGQRVRR